LTASVLSASPFRFFTTTKMRVHSTGELQGEVRVAACKYVPDASRQFYLAEREREAAAATERAAQISEFTRMQQKREKVIQAKGRLLMIRQKVSQPAQFDWLRKMASTAEAYCGIAIAESNTRRRDQSSRKVQNVRSAFRASMQAAATRRKEQDAAAQSIAAARKSLNFSDDDTSPHNEFDDLLDEICAETGYASDESEDEMW
jgi:hypothetical protein